MNRDEWFEIRVKDPESQRVIEIIRADDPTALGELSQEVALRGRRGELPTAFRDTGFSVVAEIVHVRQLKPRERKRMAAAGGPTLAAERPGEEREEPRES